MLHPVAQLCQGILHAATQGGAAVFCGLAHQALQLNNTQSDQTEAVPDAAQEHTRSSVWRNSSSESPAVIWKRASALHAAVDYQQRPQAL